MTIIRGLYKSPPSYGARVVAHILNTPHLLKEYKRDVKHLSLQLKQRRQMLRKSLESLNTPGDWSHLTETVGLLCDLKLNSNNFTAFFNNLMYYLFFTEIQCDYLKEKYHIYIEPCSFISWYGVHQSNIEYLSQAIFETVTNLNLL